nr:13303_t:CDS:2 [Entrophospora candida]
MAEGGHVHSVLFEGTDVNVYGSPENLQFYPTPYEDPDGVYSAQSNSIFYPPPMQQTFSHHHNYQFGGSTGSLLSAFGTGGFADEPPLLDELGINFDHIKTKSLAVLNPFKTVNKHIMDDADLFGPLLFCLIFGVSLLLTGKVHFGYIYGVALLGWASIYLILNSMSESSVDGYCIASVLGYCLLPLVLLSCIAISIIWSTYSSSTIFVTVLQMKEQHLLIAYPIALLYVCFALMTIF